MPTNILRRRNTPVSSSARSTAGPAGAPGARRVLIVAGQVRLRAELLESATADRIWTALPLYSAAETWGAAIQFELPVESGRDRTARLNGLAGEIYYWSEDDRVIIPFGPTPISRGADIRLPSPCNVWAKALDDVTLLKTVRPGEKVSVTVA